MFKNLPIKSLLLSMAMATCTISSRAQIPKTAVNIQSPNAASLGLFGEVPVSYFTGVPNIGVPLYVLTDGGISIPLSLGYHASGFRPDQHPGWVGMGWALQSGGMISRVVNNKPDDYKLLYNPQDPGHGYDTFHYALNTPRWNAIGYMDTCMLNNAWASDMQPDVFNFNFLGYSGEFSMDALGNWLVKCDKPLKVSNLSTKYITPPFTPFGYLPQHYGLMPTYRGFMITAEDGTQYIFGNTSNAIEYSIPFFNQHFSQWTANCWYLTQIIRPTGQQATLTYERGNYVNQMGINIYSNIGTWAKSGGGGFLQVDCSSSNNIANSIYFFYNGSLIAPVYLKTIQTDNATVSFVRSKSTELKYPDSVYSYQYSQWQMGSNSSLPFLPYLQQVTYSFPQVLDSLQWCKLDQIRISNNNGLLRTFNFTYNNVSTERLKLLSVVENGASGEASPPYTFSYDSSVALPGYCSNKTDHWGFYNGTYADISNINSYWLTYYPYRNPNATYLYAGTLNRIKYPTGGATDFLYEPNYYGAQVGLQRWAAPATFTSSQLCGGLRIKKITTYEDLNQSAKKMEKEYFYVKGYTKNTNPGSLLSSGVLGGQIKYYFDDYSMPAYNEPGSMYSKHIFSSQSVLPETNNSMGSHIGYTEVVEKRNDSSYTKYTFSNFDNGYRDDSADNVLQITRTAYEPCNSKEEYRGKLLKEEVYNSNDQLVKKRTMTYAVNDFFLNKYTKLLKANGFAICPDVPGQVMYEGTAFKRYMYNVLPVSDTETIYDANGLNPVSTYKTYTYSPANGCQIVQTRLYNSNGYNFIQAVTHPDDIELTRDVDEEGPNVYTDMTYRNIVNVAVYKSEAYRKNGDETIGGLKNIKTITTNFYSPSSGIYVPQTIDVADKNNSAETRFRYYTYDTKGNVLTASKESDVKMSYVYGYKGFYPIASVANAAQSDIAYTSFEDDGIGIFGNWSVSSATRYGIASLTGKKSYSLSSGSITASGLTSGTTYIVSYWSKAGAATVNAVTATAGSTINGWTYYQHKLTSPVTSVTVSGSVIIDELRLYPEKAFMTTYTYEPLVGITSECNPNNQVTYYNYDGFARLVLVSDQYKNIIKKLCYNYFGQVENCQGIGNVSKSDFFPRNNCSAGYQGSIVTYSVPANTYYAYTQAEADQLAQNDVSLNGQSYANAHGSCMPIYYNVAKSATVTRNNCNAGYQGSTVTYTVPANTYSSVVSQAAADSTAQAAANANGQVYVNSTGTCTPIVGQIYSYNTRSGYSIKFTEVSTGTITQYNVPIGSNVLLGNLQTGTYNIQVTGNFLGRTIQFCSYSSNNVILNFSNVVVNAANSTCMILRIL